MSLSANHRNDATVMPSKRVEQLISHIFLARLYDHLCDEAAALMHVRDAHRLAIALTNGPHTFRMEEHVKIVRIGVAADGLTDCLLLLLHGQEIVTPKLDLHDIALKATQLPSSLSTLSLTDIDIVYRKVRLRPRSVAAWLGDVASGTFQHAISEKLTEILNQCLYSDELAPGPLDIADDYFTAAWALARHNSLSLAGLSLKKADAVLREYSRTTSIKAHIGQVDGLLAQINRLTQTLNTAKS